jgi:hypothetical protein
MLTRPYTLIPDRITLPDSSPDRTYTYPALHGLTRLNYLTQFFSRLDFYLPGLTWSYPIELPYPISSDQTSAYPIVPGHLTRPGKNSLHTSAYPALPTHLTLPGTLKASSLASHLDLGLFWLIMHQYSSGNPKPTRITLKQPG